VIMSNERSVWTGARNIVYDRSLSGVVDVVIYYINEMKYKLSIVKVERDRIEL
jgi:hypothetical protein